MAWTEHERTALVSTARSADPDGPTLCEGWTVRHLVAHLVQREHRPVRSTADMLSRREPGDERFLGALVAGARSPAGYQALIDRFEGGAPRWSPVGWAGDAANLLEYVVHHEDIRRAGVDPAPPRELPPGQPEVLRRRVISTARLTLRGAPVGVALQVPGQPPELVRKGTEVVTVTGEPVELALYALGRRTAATVELTGPPQAASRLRSWAG